MKIVVSIFLTFLLIMSCADSKNPIPTKGSNSEDTIPTEIIDTSDTIPDTSKKPATEKDDSSYTDSTEIPGDSSQIDTTNVDTTKIVDDTVKQLSYIEKCIASLRIKTSTRAKYYDGSSYPIIEETTTSPIVLNYEHNLYITTTIWSDVYNLDSLLQSDSLNITIKYISLDENNSFGEYIDTVVTDYSCDYNNKKELYFSNHFTPIEHGSYSFKWIVYVNGQELSLGSRSVVCNGEGFFYWSNILYNKSLDDTQGQVACDFYFHNYLLYDPVNYVGVKIYDGSTLIFEHEEDTYRPRLVSSALNLNKIYTVIREIRTKNIVHKDTTTIDGSEISKTDYDEGCELYFGDPIGKASDLNILGNTFLCVGNIIDSYDEYDYYQEANIIEHKIPAVVYSSGDAFFTESQLYKKHYSAFFEYTSTSYSTGEFQNPGNNVGIASTITVDFTNIASDSNYYYGCGSYFTYENISHDLSNTSAIHVSGSGTGTFRLTLLLADDSKLQKTVTLSENQEIFIVKQSDFNLVGESTLSNPWQYVTGVSIELHKEDNVSDNVACKVYDLAFMGVSEYKIIAPNKYGTWDALGEDSRDVVAKPIIYLYPTDTTNVNVKVEPKGEFIYTYPHYPKNGWDVKACPDGTLYESVKGRKLYSLFWESTGKVKQDDATGFVVSSDNLESFFEDKLEKLGLNYKEKQEFIVFWAPILQRNKYNYIHFSIDEYKKWAPMNVTPKPDTEIRFVMLYKAVNRNHKVEEQKIITPKRDGFVVVEWGGSEIRSGGSKIQ